MEMMFAMVDSISFSEENDSSWKQIMLDLLIPEYTILLLLLTMHEVGSNPL